MNARIRALIARVSREGRPFVWLLLVVAAYWCLRIIFFFLTSEGGLITPSGAPNLGLAVLGIALVGLRIWVLFAVPAILVYRLARFL